MKDFELCLKRGIYFDVSGIEAINLLESNGIEDNRLYFASDANVNFSIDEVKKNSLLKKIFKTSNIVYFSCYNGQFNNMCNIKSAYNLYKDHNSDRSNLLKENAKYYFFKEMNKNIEEAINSIELKEKYFKIKIPKILQKNNIFIDWYNTSCLKDIISLSGLYDCCIAYNCEDVEDVRNMEHVEYISDVGCIMDIDTNISKHEIEIALKVLKKELDLLYTDISKMNKTVDYNKNKIDTDFNANVKVVKIYFDYNNWIRYTVDSNNISKIELSDGSNITGKDVLDTFKTRLSVSYNENSKEYRMYMSMINMLEADNVKYFDFKELLLKNYKYIKKYINRIFDYKCSVNVTDKEYDISTRVLWLFIATHLPSNKFKYYTHNNDENVKGVDLLAVPCNYTGLDVCVPVYEIAQLLHVSEDDIKKCFKNKIML